MLCQRLVNKISICPYYLLKVFPVFEGNNPAVQGLTTESYIKISNFHPLEVVGCGTPNWVKITHICFI